MDQSEFQAVQDAINKLTLNDASVEINIDHSAALGQGWRLGFLGLLHMDVFEQRLRQEFLTDTILTAPNVPYKGENLYYLNRELSSNCLYLSL